MLRVPRQCRGTHTQVQYSPWSSPPSLVLLIEEKEDQHRQYLQFGLHGVLVPRAVWRDCCLGQEVRELCHALRLMDLRSSAMAAGRVA
ncbi:hypothetical protein NDU88_006364 [Pleurodeles waltl]|uniref:Uncharacterized protein n=1 Tax=Pleurodeles waltl TaxID=8319 RepID=A0AAV7N2T3_PLEWA|nr:hypothetical protein NDU88_006364 [Pleurodeles waltl]